MIEVKTLEVCSLMPCEMDNEFPFFTREVYEDINTYKEDVVITRHPIRPWIKIKYKTVYVNGKRKIEKIETWNNPNMGKPFTKPYTPEELLGYWDTLCKPYLVADSYELMKQGLIKQMRKPKHFKHNICQLNNNYTISGKTINQRLIGMLNTKTRKQCTYTPGTSYCIHCGECKPHNYAVEHPPREDKTGLTFAYPNIPGYTAFKTKESILFYYDSMRPYQGHDINRIRDNYSIRNPLSKSDNDITVVERVYTDNGYHDFILHRGHDYSRIKAFDKEPEFIIHNGKRICRICGKKLRNNGKYCKSHTRSEINSFNRKISYITNLGHAKESYKQSASATVHYGDLDGVDYIDNDVNPTPWNYTNYIKIQKDPNNRGRTQIKHISGTGREYVKQTIKNKAKSKYTKLLRLMGFGSPSKHKYNTESNEKHIISVKPSRFCKHIIRNDNGVYRCDCLKHELIEANDCNTWNKVKVYGHHNDNIMEEDRDIKRPEYSPSSYNYTGLNPTSIPTMRVIPPEKLNSNIFINTSNNYKKKLKK